MLRIEHFTKRYGEKLAVEDLSLHIAPGEIFGFIGHNGAGKTTTLKACCGILHFDQGEIFINGKSIQKDPIGCKREMAYVPDNPDLYEFLTGIQYLNFTADIYGVGKAERTERIRRYGEKLGMTDDLTLPISDCSHGMKQKIALMAALIHEPNLILMDEPFVGLDPVASHQLKQLMQEQNYAYGVIKCWPEMGNLNSVPCAVLGRLADEGYAIACEGDVDVSLAMAFQNALTGKANFITDLIDINDQENYLTFWHCGNAAPSLHQCNCGVKLCDHPLYNKGSAFRAVLKEGPVTVSRFCNVDGKYKLFLLKGTAIPTTMYTPGCMVNVKVDVPVRDVTGGIIREAVPHHYSIVWEDVADDMRLIASILGIEVIQL